MNILDTNGISYIFNEKISLTEDYFLAPDVKEESEMTELEYNKKLPSGIKEIIDIHEFDETKYLNYYNSMLNNYAERSFFNMTGFGDVSILATVHTILAVFKEQLFNPLQETFVFTGDKGLIKKIKTEFENENVTIKSNIDIT